MSHPLICMILKTLSYFFEEKLFGKMFSDILAFIQGADVSDEEKRFFTINYNANHDQEFAKFIFYFVFLLKLCNKNGMNSSEDIALRNEEQPIKKMKPSYD